jgi:hypothetical protein
MLPVSAHNILLLMAAILFVLGMITMLAGIIILSTRAMSKDMRTLATQTTKLVQKGIAEDVAGLVGNATTLLESVNQLVRTATGIGVFLTVLGFIIIAAACWLALQAI